MSELPSLLVFVGVVFAAALSGAVFMPGDWYKTLAKPSWTPPNWLFAPAWTILYIMIAVAGWLVWRADGFGIPLAFWSLNLVFNAAWSWLMFRHHQIAAALADAVAMLATILAFIVTAWPTVSSAALLFIPYLAWVTFATGLNWSILQLNPSVGIGRQSS